MRDKITKYKDIDVLSNIELRQEFKDLYNSYKIDPIGIQLLDAEGIAPWHLDIGARSFDYFNNRLADIATDSNSNSVENYSPVTYRSTITDGMMKLLGYHMLWHYSSKRYGVEWANTAISKIWDGIDYFHDAHGVKIQMPYCFAFSLSNLVYEGRPYGPSPNTPPKRRKSFISQLDKLISDMSRQFAGATAPSDFFLWYAYFCKKENMNLEDVNDLNEIINDYQGLVCLFNEPSRAEGESPFVNIGMYDVPGLHKLFDHIVYPDESLPDFDYIMNLQRIFANWFAKGDPNTGFPYRFPVSTMNLTTDENDDFIDEQSARWFAAANRIRGNFNCHFGQDSKMAMCCRYENDLALMDMSPDAFGNGGVNIGSHRVITLNLPDIALQSGGDHTKFKILLDDNLEIIERLLLVHRYDILEGRIKKNPEYLNFFGKLGWFSLKHMFSTIGITGVFDACKIMGYNIVDDDGTEFAQDMLQHIKWYSREATKRNNVSFNVEEIPGEQACVNLARKTNIRNNTDFKLFSNQYIPLTEYVDGMTRIELSGRFMRIVSGGGIVHYNVENQIDTDEKSYELLRFCAKSGINHIAICHRFGKCVNGHTNIVGTHGNKCPECGENIYWTRSRVIGYYSDEINWNPIRREYDAPNRYYENIGDLLGEEE